MKTTFDAIVIGGGSGGLAFAKEAARRNAIVLMIERARLGGTCVNRGCVPKKMMWSVADSVQTLTNMTEQGIFDLAPTLNLGKLADLRASRIDEIVKSFDDELKEAGVTHIQGNAVLISPTDVQVGDTVYSTERIIIATGGRPSQLDIPGDNLMDTSDDVFDWTDIPDRLVVIGPGYIGCEMAAIFNALGSKVTLVSNGSCVLTEFSGGSRKMAGDNLKSSGVDICYDTKPTKVMNSNDGIMVALSNGTKLLSDRVLNATGRDQNLEVFGDLDVPELVENGSLKIDCSFATSVPGIFAIGDVANRLPLTPVAREDGATLAKQLFGAPDTPQIDLELVATTAFLFPPIGEVGQTGEIDKITTFTAMETLVTSNNLNEGWALQRGSADGLSGVCIVGHSAAESVSWAGQLLPTHRTREEMNDATAVHPSKAEEPLGSEK